VPALPGTDADQVARGAYVVYDSSASPSSSSSSAGMEEGQGEEESERTVTVGKMEVKETGAGGRMEVQGVATPGASSSSSATAAEGKTTEEAAAAEEEESSLPDAIILATGSEVQLALQAAELLSRPDRGALSVRVVSCPSLGLFDQQPDAYKKRILPSECLTRVSVEAGSKLGWGEYTGPCGRHVGMSTFGLSGAAAEVFAHFDVTAEAVARAVEGSRRDCEELTQRLCQNAVPCDLGATGSDVFEY
jgi:hypothetical protein